MGHRMKYRIRPIQLDPSKVVCLVEFRLGVGRRGVTGMVVMDEAHTRFAGYANVKVKRYNHSNCFLLTSNETNLQFLSLKYI